MFSSIYVVLVFVVLLKATVAHRKEPAINYLPCPHGWVTYKGSSSCYKVPSKTTSRWYEARKNCLAMGGDLAIISSAKENDYVGFLIHTYFPTATSAWIGFIADSNRQFKWVDGTPVNSRNNFINWLPGEPNNLKIRGVEENCGSMRVLQRRLKWNDLQCFRWNEKISYACEKERRVGKI